MTYEELLQKATNATSGGESEGLFIEQFMLFHSRSVVHLKDEMSGLTIKDFQFIIAGCELLGTIINHRSMYSGLFKSTSLIKEEVVEWLEWIINIQWYTSMVECEFSKVDYYSYERYLDIYLALESFDYEGYHELKLSHLKDFLKIVRPSVIEDLEFQRRYQIATISKKIDKFSKVDFDWISNIISIQN